MNFMDLMTNNAYTPNKIEDIEVGKYNYSAKKENNLKNNLTNSTVQPLLPGHEESPVSYRDRRKLLNHDNNYSDRHLALFGNISRDSSPVNTSYHKNIETPSCHDRTPRQPILLTPIVRESDFHDEGQLDQFNLFQYPFDDQI